MLFFLRRPGQAIYIGRYRLCLLTSSRRGTHWRIDLPTHLPCWKASGVLTAGHTAKQTFFSLVPGEWVQLAGLARVSLTWSSRRQAHVQVIAPAGIRLLRAELVEAPPHTPLPCSFHHVGRFCAQMEKHPVSLPHSRGDGRHDAH